MNPFDLDQTFWDNLYRLLRMPERLDTDGSQSGDILRDDEVASVEEYVRTNAPGVNFTCLGCSEVGWCEWTFDAYNTDGACLAEK